MSAIIIQGRAIADGILANIAEQVRAMEAPVHLAVLSARDNPAVELAVRLKQKAAQSCGIQFSSYAFEADDAVGAREAVTFLAADESVHGLCIELPLPAAWDTEGLIRGIPPEKDVDALTTAPLVPAPAVTALRYVLEQQDVSVASRTVAVVGQGQLIGAPVTRWLRDQGAQVIPIDINTNDPARQAASADILVAGAGVPGLITDEWVNEGATVIDFGYARRGDTWVGDVDADSVIKKAAALTPVPGGMGPIVIASVLENLLTLAVRGES